MYLNSICNDKIPDSTRMTKDSGDDGMPELDDISKIGKKVRTRPSQKTIKTQDHLTRPSHKAITQDHLTRPSHKTISQDHLTRRSHKTITQDHLTRPPHKTISQDHHKRPSHKTISHGHLTRPPRLKTRPSQMLITLHFGYTSLHFTSRTNKQTKRNRKVRFRQCYVSDIGYTCTFTLLAITLRPGCTMIYL